MNTPVGGLAALHPAYFALVMATGIVSIACELLGHRWLAGGLLVANLAFYPALWALTLARALRHRAALLADLQHHGRAVGFFTTVAATCVLGSQLLVVGGHPRVALGLWIAGIALWATLTYAIFTILITRRDKPTLVDGLHGGWLVSVVAAQSVAALGTQLAPGLGDAAAGVLFFCLVMWLGALMLYLWIIGLIFYRYLFFPMSPSDLSPPYWINMGAAAISTLVGALLAGAAAHSPVVAQVLPFVRGLTLLWWANATWWIPMLLILGLWRHGLRRYPLRYDPLYWGAVFPIGMYTAATARLSVAVDAGFLIAIARVTVWIALAAWTLTALAMAAQLVRRRRG
jgi:tellurite resistance protein TehA-like permease